MDASAPAAGASTETGAAGTATTSGSLGDPEPATPGQERQLLSRRSGQKRRLFRRD